MRCVDVKERLSAYLDRELEPVQERPVEEHLEQCLKCREYLADLQTIDGQLQALPRVDMGAEFAEAMTVKVCKDFLARDGSPVGRTGLLEGWRTLSRLSLSCWRLLVRQGHARWMSSPIFLPFQWVRVLQTAGTLQRR